MAITRDVPKYGEPRADEFPVGLARYGGATCLWGCALSSQSRLFSRRSGNSFSTFSKRRDLWDSRERIRNSSTRSLTPGWRSFTSRSFFGLLRCRCSKRFGMPVGATRQPLPGTGEEVESRAQDEDESPCRFGSRHPALGACALAFSPGDRPALSLCNQRQINDGIGGASRPRQG
jgi:hypothetical protein